jgi:hypothetical protein
MNELNLKGMGGDGYMAPGEYLAYIFDVKDNDRVAKPAIDVVFKNDSGDIVRRTFYLTEAALPFLARLFIAAGCADGPNDPRMEKMHPSKLQGRKVMIKVVKESKDGKEYSEVKSYWKPKDENPGTSDPARDDDGFEAYDRQKQEDPF